MKSHTNPQELPDANNGTGDSDTRHDAGAAAASAPGEKAASAAGPRTPPDRVTVAAIEAENRPDLSRPEYFLNRELTWLNFNFRVLNKAEDARTALLERLRVLSILSSNLDEFFMKRIGGLKQQVGAGVRSLTLDGRTPEQQIKESYALVHDLEQRKREAFLATVRELREQGIVLTTFTKLSEEDQKSLRDYYREEVFPLVTPQATDPAHPFPFISNLSVNLLVTLRYSGDRLTSLARVKVPVGSGVPRLLRVLGKKTFVPLENVIAHNLDLPFPGMEIDSWSVFRVTRNANTELAEEKADDLLAMIETELRERKFAPVVRLEVSSRMSPMHRGMLAADLGLDEQADVFEVDGMLGLRDLMELAELDEPSFREVPHRPVDNPRLTTERSIFQVIREKGSILLQHPYESFNTSVGDFLKQASRDPAVKAMKMVFYRTSPQSKAVEYLIDAARNGKQVAVVMELKARFDEAANIRWANHMGEAGIHVTYGVVGLKTHCKVILVVREEDDGLRRYAHIGTGNYHAGLARLYSDLGMLTCDSAIGEDLTELFNYLTTGYKPKRKYKKVIPAPKGLKRALLDKIEREMHHHTDGRSGHIQFKVNALEDPDIIRALYRASEAGVKIDLIVRDTCCLRPGIAGLSENVRVISIVDRFLEHARLLYFKNGGDEEYFLSSADCMTRNFETRIEILVPVECSELRQDLRYLLDVQLDDFTTAWEMQGDGSYELRQPPAGAEARSSQQAFIEWSEKRLKEATRLKWRQPRGVARRSGTWRRS